MSESDQTWNAAGDETTPANEASETPESRPAPAAPSGSAADHSWPQYSWPEPDAAPTLPSTPATEGPAPSVSWPAAQERPATTRPQPTIEFTPLGAPGPYAGGTSHASGAPASGSGGAGGWGPPPGWVAATPTWPPTAPAPAPAPAPTSSMPSIQRRVLAIVAVVALVLASAGIGAGIAVAVHDGSKTTPFSAGLVQPNTGTNPSGSSGSSGSTTPGSIDVNAIAAKVDPALVNINTTLAQGRAAGTGMLISSDGEILTNNHVIADAKTISVIIGGKGDSHDAKVIGYDVSHDVALLKITDDVKDLPTIVFGDPSKVKVGDPVVAIGNAGGVGGTPSATSGRVTALDQQVTASDGQGNQETLEGMIQIDAPIQPGDSGGALINRDGQIIGMNTAAAGGGRFSFNMPSASNVGFAIPIDNAVQIVSQIRSGKETDTVFIGERGLLGVLIEDVNGNPAPVTSGAYVSDVQQPSGAADAGIAHGDVVTEVGGKAVTDSDSLRAALSHYHAGDSVKVVWVDTAGNQHDATVTLVPGPPL